MSNRMHAFRTTALAAVIAGFATAAMAQATNQPTPPNPPVPSPPATPVEDERSSIEAAFARADADGDGKLNVQEAARLPAVAAKFDDLDRDKDGFISHDEFIAGVRIQR